MLKSIKKEKKEILNIFDRIKKRDFSGNSGKVIKNSVYQLSEGITYKVGSFLFTILLARLLMPELFGLYSLVLGTIILFSNFTNMGTGKAILKFVSNSFGKKKDSQAKAYLVYILKIQMLFLIGVSLLLILLSKFLAENYYNKPVFLALLAGSIYILFSSFQAILETILQAQNNFKAGLFREIFFEVLRLILVPAIIWILLKGDFSKEFILFMLIISLSLVYLASFIFLLFFSKKDLGFLKSKTKKLTKKQKTTLNYFLVAVSTTMFSGIFLGYIDMILLGHFVLSEFIGYYGAAFGVVGALVVLSPFSLVLFPVFSRLKGKRLELGFNKSIKIAFLISFALFFCSFLAAPFIIKILYGPEYSLSLNIFRVLSLLILSMPLISIYENYFISQGKQKLVAILLLGTTLLNLGVMYLLITWLISYSQLAAVFGAAIAIVFSRSFYLFLIILSKRKYLQKS